MSDTAFGIVELLLVFGFVLAFAFWELYALRRDKRRQKPGDGADKT